MKRYGFSFVFQVRFKLYYYAKISHAKISFQWHFKAFLAITLLADISVSFLTAVCGNACGLIQWAILVVVYLVFQDTFRRQENRNLPVREDQLSNGVGNMVSNTSSTFINGGTYYYPYVFMLIRLTGLTLVEIFFWIVPMAARLIRLISIKTKEY